MGICSNNPTANKQDASTLDEILTHIDEALTLAKSLDRNRASHWADMIECGLGNARFAAEAEFGLTQKAIREEDEDEEGTDKQHDVKQDARFFRGIKEGEDWKE